MHHNINQVRLNGYANAVYPPSHCPGRTGRAEITMTGLRYLAYFAPFLLLCVLYPGSLAQLIDVQAFIGFSAPVFLIRMALINQILPLRQLRSESPYAAYFYHRTMARACTIAPLFPVIYCYTYAFFQQSPPEQLGPIIAYTVLGTMYCILYYTWHLSLECRALNANDDTQRFLTGHQRFSLLLATAMFLALVGAIAVVLFSALELDDAQGVLSYVMDQFDLVTTVSYLPVSALVTWLVFTLFCAWSYVKLGYRLCSGTACFLKACAVTAPLAAAIVAAAISLYQRVARQQSEVPALEQPEYHGKRWQSALFFLFCLGVFGFSLVSLGLERSSLFATAIFGAAPFWFIRKRVRLEHTIEARTAALQVAERALIEEQKQRIEFVRGAFGKYVSRAVVDEIMANPEMVGQLGGEQRYMSAFFSDVTSFSAISERLTPTELVQPSMNTWARCARSSSVMAPPSTSSRAMPSSPFLALPSPSMTMHSALSEPASSSSKSSSSCAIVGASIRTCLPLFASCRRSGRRRDAHSGRSAWA